MAHATARRPEQVPRHAAAGQHADRGRRAEPVQLAGGRDRPGPGAAPAEEARAGPGGAAAAAATLAGGGHKAGRTVTRIAVAFEAGRDGFWLARWLRARGVEAHVIHPTSVAVSREHRRAKTDRLDTELLKRAFLGWLRGEPDHCSMAAVPTLEEEDARRPNRERECLMGERTRIVNRIKAGLVRLGIRGFKPALQNAAERLETLRTPEGDALPPNILAELRRDMARLRLVTEQVAQVEEARLERLEQQPAAGQDATVRLLTRVVGVGVETADMLVHEVLPRGLRDRRAVARYAGLTGSPDESGSRRREKGLAKAGSARVRRGMIQLAWRFLLHQPAPPEGQRARAVVPGADRGCPQRHAQDADRGAGEEAARRAVAAGDHGQGAGGPRPAPGVTGRVGHSHERGASALRRALATAGR
jgi:transposase